MKISNATPPPAPHITQRVVKDPTPKTNDNYGGPVGRFPVPTPTMPIAKKHEMGALDTSKAAQHRNEATLETAQGTNTFDIAKHANVAAKAVEAYKANQS